MRVTEFVNADTIARGLSEFQPETVAVEAGRIMIRRLRELAAQRANFAFETTLASRTFAPWIAGLRRTGYAFHLVYLWLHSADMAVSRVAGRVRIGGHHVPEDTVRRRYRGGLRNFFTLYRPLATTWLFYENVNPVSPRIVAMGRENSEPEIHDLASWNLVMQEFTNGGSN
jgi:predicted ABC-type ATPase